MFEMDILTVACFLVLSAFYSGMEIGIYVLDPLRYHVKLKEGDHESRLLSRLLARKSELVTSLLVGTNLSIFFATIFSTRITKHFYEGGDLATEALLTTAFTTPAVLIFAEMLPKNIYRRRANTLVYSSMRAFYISNLIFTPFVKALAILTGTVNYIFGRHASLENEFLTRKSVEHHLTDEVGHSALSQSQLEMVRNIMQLPSKNLTTSMIPLRDAVMVEETATRNEIMEIAARHRFSRMPVYSGSRSNIIGVLNIFDLFYDSSPNPNEASEGEPGIKELIRPIPSISRSARIDEALVVLRDNHQPMGLATKPNKSAAGIVTLKDLLEEITGEIRSW